MPIIMYTKYGTLEKIIMKKMECCILMMSTAFVLTAVVTGEEKGAARNEAIRSELAQSEKLVESAGKSLIEQAEASLSVGASKRLDVLKTQLSVLESRLSIMSLNNFVAVNAPSPLQIEEKKRALVTEIKANLEAQIQIWKVNYSDGLVGSKEMMFSELKLYLFLLGKHELMGLNKTVLERQIFELMVKLSKLGEEKSKLGV